MGAVPINIQRLPSLTFLLHSLPPFLFLPLPFPMLSLPPLPSFLFLVPALPFLPLPSPAIPLSSLPPLPSPPLLVPWKVCGVWVGIAMLPVLQQQLAAMLRCSSLNADGQFAGVSVSFCVCSHGSYSFWLLFLQLSVPVQLIAREGSSPK